MSKIAVSATVNLLPRSPPPVTAAGQRVIVPRRGRPATTAPVPPVAAALVATPGRSHDADAAPPPRCPPPASTPGAAPAGHRPYVRRAPKNPRHPTTERAGLRSGSDFPRASPAARRSFARKPVVPVDRSARAPDEAPAGAGPD